MPLSRLVEEEEEDLTVFRELVVDRVNFQTEVVVVSRESLGGHAL